MTSKELQAMILNVLAGPGRDVTSDQLLALVVQEPGYERKHRHAARFFVQLKALCRAGRVKMTMDDDVSMHRYRLSSATDNIKFDSVHNFTIEITKENLHNQVCSAIEGGGCGYWARVDVHEHKPGRANYFTATFTIIEVSDLKHGAIQGSSYTLSIPKLIEGMMVLYRNKDWRHHFCEIIREDGDATTGDVLVQCALFGHIVYG